MKHLGKGITYLSILAFSLAQDNARSDDHIELPTERDPRILAVTQVSDADLDSNKEAFAECPNGYTVVGGGFDLRLSPFDQQLTVSVGRNGPRRSVTDPIPDLPNRWHVWVRATSAPVADWAVEVTAICFQNSPFLPDSDPIGGEGGPVDPG